MGEEKSYLGTTKDLIEVVGKFVLGTLALCYALGLVVVNIYYNQYGVYSLSLFRLNYVMAGLWSVTPILLVFFFYLIVMLVMYLFSLGLDAYRGTSISEAEKPAERLAVKYVILLIALLPVSIYMMYLFISQLGVNISGPWYYSIILSIFLFLLAAFMFKSFIDAPQRHRRAFLFGPSILILVLLLHHTRHFATYIYGTIPPHLGGGGTKDVQLLLDVDEPSKKYFELSGLRFYENTNQTRTAQLLFVTEDDYVFLVKPPEWKTASTLSIKKDSIKSVLYEGLLGGGSDTSFGDSDEPTQPTATPTAPPQTSPSQPDTLQSPSPPPSSEPAPTSLGHNSHAP